MTAHGAMGRQFGIQVEGVTVHSIGGMTVYKGRIAEGQTGYRGLHEDELQPRPHVPGSESRGYQSRGKYSAAPERHSRGATQFSANPDDVMTGERVTHRITADIGGLPFRTLKKPEGNVVHADAGLGISVVGEMRWDRIKAIHDTAGRPHPHLTGEGYGTPGDQIAVEHLMDTGEHPRRGR